MKANSFVSIERILLNDGWVFVRQCGSHRQYKKSGVRELVTLPCHKGKDVSNGVIGRIEKITGLTLCDKR